MSLTSCESTSTGTTDSSQALYSTWWWLMVLLCLATVICGVLLAKSDCDLLLLLYSTVLGSTKTLQGKVIWVTGASSGIGENLCYELARAGGILILSARRKKELERVLQKCKELSPERFKDRHMILTLDLTDMSKHPDLVQKVIKQYARIDYLVNNAGRSQRAEAVATELDVDRAVLELNVMGTLSLTKAVLPEMVACRSGCVVIMSSVAGKIGAPGAASYSASKHALQGFFDTIRMELADKNISFVSICPGPVDTPFIHNLFTEKLDVSPKDTLPPRATGDRVTAERCAQLTAVAMANRLEEVWISRNPILFFTYMNQYFPNLAKWLGKRIGNKRLKAIKSGSLEVDGGYFRK